MDLKKLSTGERVLGAAGLFLVVDLLFLPWHRISFLGISESRSAVEAPNSFLGVLALLVVVALVAHIVVREFTSVKLPDIHVSWARADLLAAVAVAALLILKMAMETNYLGIGAWLAMAATGVLLYGAWSLDRETPVESTPAL
jgi:hypothetical protein